MKSVHVALKEMQKSLLVMLSTADALRRDYDYLVDQIRYLGSFPKSTTSGIKKRLLIPALEKERDEVKEAFNKNAEEIKAEIYGEYDIMSRPVKEAMLSYYCNLNFSGSSLKACLEQVTDEAANHLKERLRREYVKLVLENK